MKNTLYKLWSAFLTVFGNIKVFRWPLWIVYDPDDFQVTGKKTAEMLCALRPGDVVVRGFRHYADGKFIPSESGWSHGAIYSGDWKMIHAVSSGADYVDAIEFARCDRIAVLRPRRGAKQAVKTAMEFVEKKVPYDFNFQDGTASLYCFELCGECYSGLDVRKKRISALFGLCKKEVYLAESFFESPDFDVVLEYNPRTGKDYVKRRRKR